jgi:hypothetical protein
MDMQMPQYGYLGTQVPPPAPPDDDLLNQLLVEAEGLYGPRFPGVTFTVQNEPPDGPLDSVFDPATNHVIIHLPSGQPEHRTGQLAQECIHVLSPATPKEATVFDRGLASLFAARHNYFPHADRYDYRAAALVVEWLNHLCPAAIQQLRVDQPRVALIGEKEIVQACNTLPLYAACFLVTRIY